MRKSIVSSPTGQPSSMSAGWLDLEAIASVELSSEDPQYPFENALSMNSEEGWRAASPGVQTVRLTFDRPCAIRRIRLEFREPSMTRSQEFALFASSASHQRKEVVRQQWTFSGGNSAVEIEDYTVDLDGVVTLEMEIDPGRHDKHAFAQLQSIALA